MLSLLLTAPILSAGSPNMIEGGPEDDKLIGTATPDHLIGAKGNDTLEGGDGDDRLEGGPGTDTLLGGAGADTFVISPPNQGSAPDIIRDFDPAAGDKLVVKGIPRLTKAQLAELQKVFSIEKGVLMLQLDVDKGKAAPLVRIGDKHTLKFLLDAKSVQFIYRLP